MVNKLTLINKTLSRHILGRKVRAIIVNGELKKLRLTKPSKLAVNKKDAMQTIMRPQYETFQNTKQMKYFRKRKGGNAWMELLIRNHNS